MSWLTDRITTLMQERGLSLDALARDLAIERARLSGILADSSTPNENLTKRLAKYFNQDPMEWLEKVRTPTSGLTARTALPADFVRVAAASDIPDGEMKIVFEDLIVIAHAEGRFHAFGNVCPHAAGPIGDGFLDGCVVECPWHAGRWDIRTGKALTLLATADIPLFDLRVVDGEIEIRLTEAARKQGSVATSVR